MFTSQVSTRIFVGVLTFLFGAVLTHLWNRYRSRLKPFKWSAWYQKIAFTAEHPSFGKLEVLHNGKQVGNVYSGRIDVENLSNSDFAGPILKIAYQEGTRILGASAILEGSIGELPLSPEFVKVIESSDPLVAGRAANNREYLVPAFNRGRKVTIFLFLARDDANVPIAQVACDYVGVALRFEAAIGNVFLGIPVRSAQIVGLIFTLGLVGILFAKAQSRWALALGSWLAGALLLFFGAVLIRLWKWLLRRLD